MNVLPREKKIEVLHHLVEGNTLRSTSRLTGVHRTTIMNLALDFGHACADYMDGTMRNLDLKHVECDEIWTFVQKKQNKLTVDERAERSDIGDVYLWTAIDAETKLCATYLLGKRSADNARKLMTNLADRLKPMPKPHQTDAHAYQVEKRLHVTQISTDGFPGYPEAVDLAFGPYAKFGVIIKQYRNANMDYTPSEMVGTERRPMKGNVTPWSICTSHVERNNLTIRTFMRRFTRLALGFSKKLENLEAAVNLHVAYFNFCWRPGKMRVTPAMAAGITNRLWSFDDLLG